MFEELDLKIADASTKEQGEVITVACHFSKSSCGSTNGHTCC